MVPDESTTFDPATNDAPPDPRIRKAVRKLLARPRKALLATVAAVEADPDKPDWAGMTVLARRTLAMQWFYREAGARWDAKRGRYRPVTSVGKRGRALLAKWKVDTVEEWALHALGVDIRVRRKG